MPVALLEHVTQRYGRVIALDDVTIELPAAGIVGLIGADGVGKSTLLSIVAGARQVQSGTAFVLGGDITDSAHRAAICPRIAYMPQGLGKNLIRTSASARTSSFSRVFSDNRGPNANGGLPSFWKARGSRHSPIARRRSSPVACVRNSACAAR